MKIELTPSGSYRIRKMYRGKTYSVTLAYKPTQKEALRLLADLMDKAPEEADLASFGAYADMFISELERKGKSPATIRGYISIIKNLPSDFKAQRLSEITAEDVQNLVDEYSEDHAPKSVRNYYGFVNSVIKRYRKHYSGNVVLPAKNRKAEYEPTTRDIKRILEASQGSKFEICLRLCSLGLRRGEAMAITAADLDGNVLSINKDIVINKNNQVVVKNTPKNESSNRRISIPAELADMIRAAGVAYSGNPHSLNEYLHVLQDRLSIPRFRLHMLRHFAAAFLHKAGFTDQQIMSYMGYESPNVMIRVYRYNLDPEESQKEITDSLSEWM